MSTKTEFFTGTIKRRLMGLDLILKSEKLEEVMRLVSKGLVTNIPSEAPSMPWKHNNYKLEMGGNGIPISFSGFGAGRFDLWGSKELVLSRAPFINLSPLLAVGLGAGVTIPVETVLSDKQLKAYADGLQSAVNQFYIDFIKPSEINIRIYTEQFD